MTSGLTKRQQAVYNCIESFVAEHGYGPTVREVCQSLGLSSPSTVHVHLKALEDKGFINRDPLKSRSISLVNHEDRSEVSALGSIGSGFSNVVELPVVGDVAAGVPILAEENITNTMSLPVEIVGINDGDYIVVKEQPTANNGDIVVALIEDGATVKRFFKEKDHIRLQPENSSMDPILVTECSIVGKVVALFRRVY